MKFEKMENGSLRCYLTQKDLQENGIELEDFFSNSKNARDFLEKLIRIAEEEVGYHTSGNMMSIQAAIMSEDEIMLTFLDNQVSGSEIIEHIKNMFGSARGQEEENDGGNALLEELDQQQAAEKEAEGENGQELSGEGYVYLVTFVSLSSVCRFCRVLPAGRNAASRLYYHDSEHRYFLWADLNHTNRKYVYQFVAASMEYAKAIEKDSARSSYLEEHADVIVREQALERLAAL